MAELACAMVIAARQLTGVAIQNFQLAGTAHRCIFEMRTAPAADFVSKSRCFRNSWFLRYATERALSLFIDRMRMRLTGMSLMDDIFTPLCEAPSGETVIVGQVCHEIKDLLPNLTYLHPSAGPLRLGAAYAGR